ncbi:hypothetical protein KI387_006408 [Taxus chinensis]|uniref:Zinc finger protein n=1 Tax=Taxus chinensis TaxID=29808 RepID=A0AA38GQK8_TAXCH|nr:hypothetical protein KI387_006408 [Taxus chinensis]
MGSDDADKFIAKKCTEDDQRRYSCQICGVVRSKRRSLKVHVSLSHGPDATKEKSFASEGVGERSQSVCDLCGMSFRKPAHLQQHKLSHSALRTFVCPIDGCLCSYKRQDHLNRHLLKHEGEFFLCPKEDCKLQLSTLSNLKRHLKQHRERGESWKRQNVKSKETKKHCCPEPNCKKAFKYPSNLAKHLDDVHSTTYTEVICCEPGCLKYFTNAEALKEHLRQNHNRVCCEICGSQQLKKQIKRHMRIHENKTCVKSISCPYERCLHSYTRKSNLNQHIQSVHLGLKPFKCRFGACGMMYAHKSARDRHETSGAHCYVQGNFIEEDAAFQSRPRGGRKRKAFTVDSIFRKRVAAEIHDEFAFRVQLEEVLRLCDFTLAYQLQLIEITAQGISIPFDSSPSSSSSKDEDDYFQVDYQFPSEDNNPQQRVNSNEGSSRGKEVGSGLESRECRYKISRPVLVQPCGICFNDSLEEMFEGLNCLHHYCRTCMTRFINSMVEQKRHQIYCPHDSGGEPLTPQECVYFLLAEIFDAWFSLNLEAQIADCDKVYCPFPDCSALPVKEEAKREMVNTECLFCHRIFCVKCKVPWHGDLDCS